MNTDKLREIASCLQQFANELDLALQSQEDRISILENENEKVKTGLNKIRIGLNEIFE